MAKSFKFLFFRLSAFMFDMVVLSFIMAISMTVFFDLIESEVKILDVMYELSLSNSVFKSFVYLFIISLYYAIHITFKRSTFGLLVTHQDYFDEIPETSEVKSEDADVVGELEENKFKTKVKRAYMIFLYASLQALNVAFLGIFTIVSAFKKDFSPFHERLSGVRIMSRDKHK